MKTILALAALLLATSAGAAYLFSIDGTLLTTFTNPTPALDDLFGSAVAAVGTNMVLVGAPGNDTGATNAGVAYLFNISGALLTTFTNPTPESDDNFGDAVAAVGTDKVLIGARHERASSAAFLSEWSPENSGDIDEWPTAWPHE